MTTHYTDGINMLHEGCEETSPLIDVILRQFFVTEHDSYLTAWLGGDSHPYYHILRWVTSLHIP